MPETLAEVGLAVIVAYARSYSLNEIEKEVSRASNTIAVEFSGDNSDDEIVDRLIAFLTLECTFDWEVSDYINSFIDCPGHRKELEEVIAVHADAVLARFLETGKRDISMADLSEMQKEVKHRFMQEVTHD